jgi:hypothetical protein
MAGSASIKGVLSAFLGIVLSFPELPYENDAPSIGEYCSCIYWQLVKGFTA